MRLNTTLAISKPTAEKIKSLAKKKGISQAVYIEKMLEFFEVNNIDYSNGDALLGSIVYKEIERVVKILRAYEKEYFKGNNETLNLLKGSLLDVIKSAKQEIEEISLENKDELQTRYDNLQDYFNNFKIETGLVCKKVRTLISQGKLTRKGDFEIVVSSQEKQEIEDKVNIIIKTIQ